MLLTIIFCSLLNVTKWLQNHLLTCPFKALTGIDCPGCGFQRSVIALLNCEWSKSLHFYAATVPLLVTIIVFAVDSKFRFDQKDHFKKAACIFTGLVIMSSYVVKLYSLYH